MARQGRNGQLPERQARFVKEYLIDQNASQAYRRAGYKSKTPNVDGPALLAKPSISEAVALASKKLNDKLEITAERIRAELAKRAFSNMEDYGVHENGDFTIDLSGCSRDQMAAVREYTVDHTGGTGDGERKMVLRTRIKLADDIRALELLGKCRDIQLFAEKVDVSHSIQTMSDEELMAKYEQLKAKENG